MTNELPIIQKTHDLIVWYVPWLNKLPRDFKFTLGDRVQATLFCILEDLIIARWRRDKLAILEGVNARLEILRHQTRLCREFKLMDAKRYEFVSRLINEVGVGLGGWIKNRGLQ